MVMVNLAQMGEVMASPHDDNAMDPAFPFFEWGKGIEIEWNPFFGDGVDVVGRKDGMKRGSIW